jgi:hypothetical protein
LSDVTRLINDPRHGESRLFLLMALKRSRDPLAVTTLQALAKDPVFAKEIASWRQTRR